MYWVTVEDIFNVTAWESISSLHDHHVGPPMGHGMPPPGLAVAKVFALQLLWSQVVPVGINISI